MGVRLHLDARYHAAGERDLVAARRIPAGDDGGLHQGQVAENEGRHAGQAVRIHEFQDREIAVVAGKDHPRRQQARVLITPHENLFRPPDHVRVGQYPPALDHETRAAGAPHGLEAPGRVINRNLAGGKDLHHRALGRDDGNRGEQLRRGDRPSDRQKCHRPKSVHHDPPRADPHPKKCHAPISNPAPTRPQRPTWGLS